jgi:hypothetical protein
VERLKSLQPDALAESTEHGLLGYSAPSFVLTSIPMNLPSLITMMSGTPFMACLGFCASVGVQLGDFGKRQWREDFWRLGMGTGSMRCLRTMARRSTWASFGLSHRPKG